MPVTKIKEFLDANNIKYLCIRHSQAFTAQEIAAAAHIPGKEMAKTVILVVDGKTAMAVLPASHKIDFEKFKKETGSSRVALPSEPKFINQFPGCEAGAMPPFGNIYDVDVYVSSALAEDEQIAFNACSHSEVIQMFYGDYQRLVKPKVYDFSEQLS